MAFGRQSETGHLRSLLVKHARDAFASEERIAREWRELNYHARPDLARAIEEYDRFVEVLEETGAEIQFLPADEATGLDSIYTRDAAVVCDKGVILCNMGKPERRGEPEILRAFLEDQCIGIHGAITGDGRLEGGDVVWLDQGTLAVGRGYRTNDEGIEQLSELLGDCLQEMIVVPLPHWRGPGDVFHLMSILSPIDRDLALVYSPLLPVMFREHLISRGLRLVEVPDDEFKTMGCNVLALGPRKCLMISGNPATRERLVEAGVEVHELEGHEICRKGAGGPTCLTRPLLREIELSRTERRLSSS